MLYNIINNLDKIKEEEIKGILIYDNGLLADTEEGVKEILNITGEEYSPKNIEEVII